jgi:hypothetical protein
MPTDLDEVDLTRIHHLILEQLMVSVALARFLVHQGLINPIPS